MKNGDQILEIPVVQIRPFPDQPREFFDQIKLEELAAGIKEVGLQHPIKVKRTPDSKGGIRYELIDGQRRWHAHQIAGIKDIFAIVEKVKDAKAQYIASVASNAPSEPHTVREEINIVRNLTKLGCTREEIAKIKTKSLFWVSMYARLGELPEDVLDLMSNIKKPEERLDPTTAYNLTDLPKNLQVETAKAVVGLSTLEARIHIQQVRDSKGIEKRTRDSRPNEKFNSLRNFFNLLLKERLNLVKSHDFEEIFGSVSHNERIRLMEEFNSNYELMGQMRIRMAQALKKFK